MQIKCDECDTKFTLETKTEGVYDDVERTYFECPECNEKYHCWYKNDKIYELETEREQWQKRITNPNLRKRALKEIKELTGKVASEMKRLKNAANEKVVCFHDA